MDKISKNLAKIPAKHRYAILKTSKQIRAGDLKNLDTKKLKGSKDLFRVRVGSYRIIMQARAGKNPIVVGVTKRDDQTYKK